VKLLAIDSIGYDETPLDMRQPGAAHAAGVAAQHPPSSLALATQEILDILPPSLVAVRTKLFQTQQEFAFLVKAPMSINPVMYCAIVGKSVSHLQSLYRNTPGPMIQCLHDVGAASFEESGFQQCTRIVSLDSHPSNFVVERRLRRRRRRLSKSWQTALFPCEQHKSGKIRDVATKPFESAVSGIINLGLSISQHGQLIDFQDCAREWVRANSLVLVGEPPPEVAARRNLVFKWFISGGVNQAVVRVLLSNLARGNLEKIAVFEIYVRPGVAYDENAVKARHAEGISRAIAYRRWNLYMRKKWGNAAEACCDAALPLLINEMLIPVYKMFCERQSAKAPCHRVGAAGAGVDGDDEVEDPDRGRGALVPLVADPEAMPGGAVSDGSWAAINASNRKTASTFLQSRSPGPVGQVVSLRMIVSICQSIQKEQFWIGSQRYNKMQDALAARRSKDVSEPGVLLRDYAVLVAARGVIENKAFVRIRALMFDARLWVVLPEYEWTNDLKAMNFLGLSGAGALVEKHLVPPILFCIRRFAWTPSVLMFLHGPLMGLQCPEE
jgi:hypothetical protein